MKRKPLPRRLSNQKGATIIVVALVLVVLIGVAALAIDLGYLYIVRGELQNAADSGALAGAQVLYINNGTSINPGVYQTALALVSANYSEKSPVAVKSIERGHWSFATKTFTSREGTNMQPVSLWNVTSAQLDADLNFINAVRVITTRKIVAGTNMPEEPFFARIFGISGPTIDAIAVAYIGFAGTLTPNDVDQPIAICKESLLNAGNYSCNVGRMINSGNSQQSSITGETGGWTDFNQVNPCQGGTNASTLKKLICGSGNPNPMALGQNLATQGGAVSTALSDFASCWIKNTDIDKDGKPDKPWSITLPVIECCDPNNPTVCNNPGPCNKMVGAVVVNVIWVQEKNDPFYNDVPMKLGSYWDGSLITDGQTRWNNFASTFKLKNANGTNASYLEKTIYFLPDCTPHIPMGTSGGQNFGILAQIPVLVD